MRRGDLKSCRISKGQRIFDVFNMIFLILLCIIMFYPMWHVLCASLSESGALARHSGVLLAPKGFSFTAYKSMFKHPLIMSGYMNSIIILVLSVSVSMILTTLCAYVLSRKNVMWNKFFNKMIVLTMFISGGMIASYLLVSRTLGLRDSYWALVFPGAIGVQNMIIMRTSFQGIPDSLVEAAELDGATHWQILWNVIVPLAKATIAVITLYYSVAVWNSWFGASIYLSSRSKFPLQLILREILIANNTEAMVGSGTQDQESIAETVKYATIVAATLPILCIYPFLQKHFTKGVMIGAVKG